MARQHVLRDITTENLDPKVKYSHTHHGKLAAKNVPSADVVEETKPVAVEAAPEKVAPEKPVAKKPAAKAQKAEEPATPAPKADEKAVTEEEKKDT